MRRLIFIFFLLLLLVGFSHLLWAQDLSGSWTGAVDVAGQSLPFTVHLERNAEGQWSGTIDIQGATGLPLKNVSAKPSKVHFELQAGPGVAVWDGAPKGETVEGTFSQSGIEGTFKMERSQEEPGEEEASQPAPYDEQDITLEAGEVSLACTYTRPHGSGPFPAVHLITGSGPQDRNATVFGFQIFRALSDQLAREGVAVMRCDDRGIAGSTGSLSQSTLPDLAKDALASVAHLRGRPEVKAGHIGLVGHSEGGIVAPLAASLSADVGFVVLLAGSGVRGRELMIEQANLIRQASGIAGERAAADRERQLMLLDAALHNRDWEEVRQRLRKSIEEGLPENSQMSSEDLEKMKARIDSFIEMQIAGVRSKGMRYFIGYDPVPALEKLTSTPVLAIFGEKDLQVPPGQNLPPMKAALERAGNPNATFKVISGANHLFQASKTGSPAEYAALEKEFTGNLPQVIAGWIHALP